MYRLLSLVKPNIKKWSGIISKDEKICRANKTALEMMGFSSDEEIVGKIYQNKICSAERLIYANG